MAWQLEWMVSQLVRIVNVMDHVEVPQEWWSAYTVPLHKGNGDKYKHSNYIGISLLSVTAKLYGRVVSKRVSISLEMNCVVTEMVEDVWISHLL